MLGWLLPTEKQKRLEQRFFAWVRRFTAANNSTILKSRMHRLRPPLSGAFDTQVSQICGVERGAWYSTGKGKWGPIELEQDTGFYGPYPVDFPERLQAEVPYIYSICELARRGDIDLFRVPTIEAEKRQASNKHASLLGCARLDDGVPYRNLGFACSAVQYETSFLDIPLSKDEHRCRLAGGPYADLFEYFVGKHQQRDAWHLVICDAMGVEFFFTCDRPFLDRYEQVRERLSKLRVRTKAVLPSNFCKELKLGPTHLTPTDPESVLRSTTW